jgi:hypothetical protein
MILFVNNNLGILFLSTVISNTFAAVYLRSKSFIQTAFDWGSKIVVKN